LPVQVALSLLSALALSACASPTSPAWQRLERTRALLGSEMRVALWSPAAERAAAEAALERAFECAEHWRRRASDYDSASELSRTVEAGRQASAGTPLPLSPELADLLARALELAEATGGAFDPTVGACTRLLRRAVRQGEPPQPQAWSRALERVGWKRVELDRDARVVRLRVPGLEFDLGGIGKGWIADRMLASLRADGFPRALVACSGDLAVGDAPPGRRGWRVAVEGFVPGSRAAEHGAFTLELARAGLSTSGDRFQAFAHDDRRLGHVFDPRTGALLEGPRAAGALAADAATADALATALCVLGPRGVETLAGRFPDCSLWAAHLESGWWSRAWNGRFGQNGRGAVVRRAPACGPQPPTP
jgi:thiamine biosynthesis lipoprotein